MNPDRNLMQRCIAWCERQMVAKHLPPNMGEMSYEGAIEAHRKAQAKISVHEIAMIPHAINAMTNLELIALIGSVLAEETDK